MDSSHDIDAIITDREAAEIHTNGLPLRMIIGKIVVGLYLFGIAVMVVVDLFSYCLLRDRSDSYAKQEEKEDVFFAKRYNMNAFVSRKGSLRRDQKTTIDSKTLTLESKAKHQSFLNPKRLSLHSI
ncbi:Oidioi.mRNA.OKI2018_I69.chr1.g711.t1.cds [Oikopleura dioica]|uniref:Oidioi.mRNA.OKI2018_I69.chr1.g711.t1.cds n=1 Tax=Oikopleura dioica TaxID=34765 RepID=A0ABN7SPY1_OIKDI|nr:Oidioi.mRNA.OKI2018_I69.chr1.g711.t1.cds [Oikopleura dioica]